MNQVHLGPCCRQQQVDEGEALRGRPQREARCHGLESLKSLRTGWASGGVLVGLRAAWQAHWLRAFAGNSGTMLLSGSPQVHWKRPGLRPGQGSSNAQGGARKQHLVGPRVRREPCTFLSSPRLWEEALVATFAGLFLSAGGSTGGAPGRTPIGLVIDFPKHGGFAHLAFWGGTPRRSRPQ